MKDNKGIVIICLIFVIVLLLGYIGYDKFFSNEKESDVVSKDFDNFETESEVSICPISKITNGYTLTDSDKEEIMNSLESLNAGFTKENVDINSMTVSNISDSGYFMNVSFKTVPNTSGVFAEVAIVNNKPKVLLAGSGDTEDGEKRMEYTLERICS